MILGKRWRLGLYGFGLKGEIGLRQVEGKAFAKVSFFIKRDFFFKYFFFIFFFSNLQNRQYVFF
jgi:hypothetical protein